MLQASILGDTSIPDWPDALAPYEAIWLPAGYLIIASIFAFSPGLILWIWADVESPIPFAIAYALSCALWPISLLGMALFEDLAALKPQFLWLSIRRIQVGYIRTAVACAVIIGLVGALLSQFHHCGLLFMMLAFPTCLYLLMVSLRMIGALYYANRTALGWFSEEL